MCALGFPKYEGKMIVEENDMVVAFCGHSTYIPNAADEKEVLAVLERVVGDVPCEFFLGEYGSFDSFAYGCAKKYKEKHPASKLFFITPYLNQEKMQFQAERFDGIIYPPLEYVPPRYAIVKRNKWIVEQADLIFAHITHEYGGAYTMYCYAKRKGKTVYMIGTWS